MTRLRDVVPIWRLEQLMHVSSTSLNRAARRLGWKRPIGPWAGASPEVEGATPEVVRVLQELFKLSHNWHTAGALAPHALRAIAVHAGRRTIRHSVETGTGKSTVLLSHLSLDHTVFVVGGNDDSVEKVQGSALLHGERVRWIFGPTQRTLPRHQFTEPLDLALIDGPHAYPFPELEYYFLYPHLAHDAVLIVDDIHIPTIFRLFTFLHEEPVFELLEVTGTTAFFRRTAAPPLDPFGDGWWTQEYNRRRFPIVDARLELPPTVAAGGGRTISPPRAQWWRRGRNDP